MTVHTRGDGSYLFHECDACFRKRSGGYRTERGIDDKIRFSLDILPEGWQKKGTKHYCMTCRTHRDFWPVPSPVLDQVPRRS